VGLPLAPSGWHATQPTQPNKQNGSSWVLLQSCALPRFVCSLCACVRGGASYSVGWIATS
jgi:hypothetical protein